MLTPTRCVAWFFRTVTSWRENLGQLEPPAAGIPKSLHAALHAAFRAAKNGTEPRAADPCRAAASGQCGNSVSGF